MSTDDRADSMKSMTGWMPSLGWTLASVMSCGGVTCASAGGL
jgi:hypothetical protein